MIKTVGIVRVFGLLLLFLVAMFLLVSDLYIFKQGLVDKNREYAAIINENVLLTDKIKRMESGIDLFEQYKDTFAIMQETDFFDAQNRFAIQPLLDSLSEEAGLIALRYEIKPAESIKSEKAKEAGHKLIRTEISFELQSLEDTNVYKFLYLLQYGFPGQVTFKTVNLKRLVTVTQPILRDIGTGKIEALVSGNVVIYWQTMIPDDSVSLSSGETQEFLEEPLE